MNKGADRVGVEPTDGFPSLDFESSALDHSAICPERSKKVNRNPGHGKTGFVATNVSSWTQATTNSRSRLH